MGVDIFLLLLRRNTKHDKVKTTQIVVAGFKKGEVMEAIEKADNVIKHVKGMFFFLLNIF